MVNNKISVCIATYNGEKYIAKQLHSILSQIKPDDEIIISDDSSSDRTMEIVANIKDPRIIVLKNNTFFTPVFNFENALNHASGDFIFLADQDDIWMNNKVEIILAYLQNADLVISDCTIVNENETLIYPSFFELTGSKHGFIHNMIKNSYIGCCMAFNRKILLQALPFPSDTPMHDWWIGLISEIYGTTKFCNEKLIAYRRHESNFSLTGEKSPYSLRKKILFRVILLKNLLRRQLFHV